MKTSNIYNPEISHYDNTRRTPIHRSLVSACDNLCVVYGLYLALGYDRSKYYERIHEQVSFIVGTWILILIKARTTREDFDKYLTEMGLIDKPYDEVCRAVYIFNGYSVDHQFTIPERNFYKQLGKYVALTEETHHTLLKVDNYLNLKYMVTMMSCHTRTTRLTGKLIGDILLVLDEPEVTGKLLADADIIEAISIFKDTLNSNKANCIITKEFIELVDMRMGIAMNANSLVDNLF